MSVTFYGKQMDATGMPLAFFHYWFVTSPAPWTGDADKVCMTAVHLATGPNKLASVSIVGHKDAAHEELVAKLQEVHGDLDFFRHGVSL